LTDVVPAINQVFGMGVDLALVLGIMGLVWTGAPLSITPVFSIGGKDPRVWNLLNNVQGVLGTPQGLDRSHNFIEADSSPTRDDLYVTGNAWTMNISRFEQWYNMVPEDRAFSSDDMADFAAKRYHESIQTNPNFYYGPFTGMVARNAGFLFITNMFANYSTANPDGELSRS
jgi:hypothetical protein